jgi:hypothetical protein
MHNPAVPVGVTKKLVKMYTGPFVVINKTSPVNYEVMNSITSSKFIVHIQQVKQYYQNLNSSESSADEDLSKSDRIFRLDKLLSYNLDKSYWEHTIQPYSYTAWNVKLK